MELQSGLYRHYKGNIYEVLGTARHSETMEALVVYRRKTENEGEELWVRPLKMFTEKLLIEGTEISRFQKL
ncbi:MAG TPA: DUF1653 domain-containing protein [Bacteroidia bacterium]|nr:DUF1653 domain-containing protein [Bacteroidia bacterium]